MKRSTFLLGCSGNGTDGLCWRTCRHRRLGPDGKPLPRVYRIRAGDTGRIQFRMLDAINALRQASGAPALELNARLNAAAATHAQRHECSEPPLALSGPTGLRPITRIQRAGYSTASLVGEAISETYESELETLGAWMEAPEHAFRHCLTHRPATLVFPGIRNQTGKSGGILSLGTPEETGFHTRQRAVLI